MVFILSVIPGLSHIYLGLFYRGCIFIGTAAAGAIGTLGFCALLGSRRPMVLLLLGFPVLWFIALIDSMVLVDKVNMQIKRACFDDGAEADTNMGAIYNEMSGQNKKIMACILSVIPGVGHMYLGYQRLGLEYMTLFFFCFFFIDWLRIGFFMFIVPVIWFYALFDALHRTSNGPYPNGEESLSIFDIIGKGKAHWNGSKFLGYGFIGLGLLLIFDRIISPLIPIGIRNYLQTAVVALLFIAGGIKILLGTRGNNNDVILKEAEKQCEGKE